MRGLPDPQPRTGGHKGVSHRQVWPDAPHLSERPPASPLQFFVADGKVAPPSGGDRCRLPSKLKTIETAMMRQEGVTEVLKAADQMEWVRRMNSIHSWAEEIILHDLIYDS